MNQLVPSTPRTLSPAHDALRSFAMLAVVIALLGMAVPASAQWSVGFRAGVNLPEEVMMLPMGNRATPKPFAGAAIRYEVASWFSVALEPQLVNKGRSMSRPFFATRWPNYVQDSEGQWVPADAGEAGYVTPSFQYLEVPVVVALGARFGDFGANIFATAAPAVLLWSTISHGNWNNEDGDLREVRQEDLSHRVAKYDLMLGLGVGISYRVNDRLELVADVRETVGVVDVISEIPSDPQFAGKDFQYYYRSLDMRIAAGIMVDL